MFYKESEMNAMHLGVTDQKIKKKIKIFLTSEYGCIKELVLNSNKCKIFFLENKCCIKYDL